MPRLTRIAWYDLGRKSSTTGTDGRFTAENCSPLGVFCVAVKPNQPFRPPKDPSPAVLLPAAHILAPCRLLPFLSSMTNSLFVGR
jgi:hypothetical protein